MKTLLLLLIGMILAGIILVGCSTAPPDLPTIRESSLPQLIPLSIGARWSYTPNVTQPKLFAPTHISRTIAAVCKELDPDRKRIWYVDTIPNSFIYCRDDTGLLIGSYYDGKITLLGTLPRAPGESILPDPFTGELQRLWKIAEVSSTRSPIPCSRLFELRTDSHTGIMLISPELGLVEMQKNGQTVLQLTTFEPGP